VPEPRQQHRCGGPGAPGSDDDNILFAAVHVDNDRENSRSNLGDDVENLVSKVADS
jgi:hypothetical protein